MWNENAQGNDNQQVDEKEVTCTVAQATKARGPAKTMFKQILNVPALQGEIPVWFLEYVEQAYLVAYFNLWFRKFDVEPKGWKAAKKWWDRQCRNDEQQAE